MAKKSSEKKKKKQNDAAPADKGRGPSKSIELSGGAEEMEAFQESFDERPGLTQSEARDSLEELMREAEEIDPADLETLSPEEREALEARFEDEGSVEDAARILEDRLKESENAEASEEPPESENAETYTVKVDGEEEEVTLDEALEGYMRGAAFTKKTQNLAEKRKQLEQTQEQYAQELEAIGLTIGNNLAPEQQQALAQRYQAVKSAIHQRQEQQRQETAAQERERLRESMGWQDESDWEIARTRLQNYATEQIGFDPAVLSQVADAKAFEILEKARRFDQGEGGKRKAAKTLKPGQGRSRRSRSNVTDARKRVARSGKMSDAADALEGILFGGE